MLYTAKGLACMWRRKLFRRQRLHGAFEDCYKMTGDSEASCARWGLIDQAFCKSYGGMDALGGQDATPKRSIQIGDSEVNK